MLFNPFLRQGPVSGQAPQAGQMPQQAMQPFSQEMLQALAAASAMGQQQAAPSAMLAPAMMPKPDGAVMRPPVQQAMPETAPQPVAPGPMPAPQPMMPAPQLPPQASQMAQPQFRNSGHGMGFFTALRDRAQQMRSQRAPQMPVQSNNPFGF